MARMEGTRKRGRSWKRLANMVEEASKIIGIRSQHASQRPKEWMRKRRSVHSIL
jgi:hypothetical protein